MKRVFVQCKKELVQFRRDRLTVALAYVLPLIAIVLYGYAIRLESKNIAVIIRNDDSGFVSREYISTLLSNQQMKPLSGAVQGEMEALDAGVAKAIIVIPAEFSRRLKSGRKAFVQVTIDATDVNNARVLRNSIIANTRFFLGSHGLAPARPGISPRIRLWFNPGREESLNIAPASIAVFLFIFPCLLTTVATAREKEQGTMLQLYASGSSSVEILGGKALAYLIIASSQAALLTITAVLLFSLPVVGNAFVFILSMMFYLLCAVSLGLLGGTLANTQSAAIQFVGTLGFTTSMLLSGFLYPLRNIVFPLSLISNFVPARYFVEASRNFFLRGSDAMSQIHILVALCSIGLLLFMLAVRASKRMQLG